MDYTESLILFELVQDRQRRRRETYKGLTSAEIQDRTGLATELLTQKLTLTGRTMPELRATEEGGYPYVEKKGNRYLLDLQTERNLILDRNHCLIFLCAIELSGPKQKSFAHQVLVAQCQNELRMAEPYLEKTITDLKRRKYLGTDESTAEGAWYAPDRRSYELECIYFGFLLGIHEPKPIAPDKVEKFEEKLRENLDNELLRFRPDRVESARTPRGGRERRRAEK